MTEDYLHFIWGNKRLTHPELKTSAGDSFQIKYFGSHNVLMAGPDFNHACIRIDGVELHGPIELHVKSSDWYAHKHQGDRNYDNVILHVVYENDLQIEQAGRKIPTFELKPFIDWQHFEKYKSFRDNRHSIVCGKLLEGSDPILLQNMMDKAYFRKVSQKVDTITQYATSPEEMMYFFLGTAFGSNLNKFPFLELLKVAPAEKLRKLSPDQRFQWLIAESGMLDSERKSSEKWHFKGNRPGNFPTKRIHQFAHLLCDDQLVHLAEFGSSKEIIQTFHEIIIHQSKKYSTTLVFREHILINAVIPYFFYLAILKQNEKYQDLGLEILEQLKPEKNQITKRWEQVGFKLKNARESQGLLALFRYYCSAKKCVSCEVGNAILKVENDSKNSLLL